MILCTALLLWGCAAPEQTARGSRKSASPAAVKKTTACGRTKFFSIGTGDVTGVYYPAGGAIAKIVNRKRSQYCMRLSVESTPGSVYNVDAVLQGEIWFGVVQSDRQYQAVNGLAEWEDRGPQKDLRSIFSLHPECVTLVAAVDSGIRTVQDLRGRRVNICNPGSGQRQNAIDALMAAGLDYQTDLDAIDIKASKSAGLLQDGTIDAFFYTVGHPSAAITEAVSGKRKTRFIPLAGIEQIVDDYPYYVKTIVPYKHYSTTANYGDVTSFGVKGTFVTSSRMAADAVYAITKEIFENFQEFKKLHPAFETLTKENMLEGMSAPLHPGAMKYYKEAGLIKPGAPCPPFCQ